MFWRLEAQMTSFLPQLVNTFLGMVLHTSSGRGDDVALEARLQVPTGGGCGWKLDAYYHMVAEKALGM